MLSFKHAINSWKSSGSGLFAIKALPEIGDGFEFFAGGCLGPVLPILVFELEAGSDGDVVSIHFHWTIIGRGTGWGKGGLKGDS